MVDINKTFLKGFSTQKCCDRLTTAQASISRQVLVLKHIKCGVPQGSVLKQNIFNLDFYYIFAVTRKVESNLFTHGILFRKLHLSPRAKRIV